MNNIAEKTAVCLHLVDPGDRSVGIWPVDDDIVIAVPKWLCADEEEKAELAKHLATSLKGWFDVAAVLTDDEYRKHWEAEP